MSQVSEIFDRLDSSFKLTGQVPKVIGIPKADFEALKWELRGIGMVDPDKCIQIMYYTGPVRIEPIEILPQDGV